MKKYKIYGNSYELQESVSEAPDCYAVKGELLDDLPKGKFVGFVVMEDGSIVECYKKFNPLPIIILSIIAVLSVAAVLVYFLYLQPKDISIPFIDKEDPVRVGTDNNFVEFDGFMEITSDNNLILNFTNGSEACTIKVYGEGVESSSITVEPYATVESIPVTFSAKDGVVATFIEITTPTSTNTYECVTEIPQNNTTGSADEGLAGYWKGEYIYGTTPIE